MSRPAPVAAAAAAATSSCPICCRPFPSSSIAAHAAQCFEAMSTQYTAALPSVKAALSVHQQAVIEASKLTASAADLAAPALPPLSQHRKKDVNEEKQLLIGRAQQLLDLAELGQTAAVPAHLLQPGDALASALHATKTRHSASLHRLCKQLRAQHSTLPLSGAEKLHLVAALKLALFALEADALEDGAAGVQRAHLELGKLTPLSQLEWLHRFVESYFLHQYESTYKQAGAVTPNIRVSKVEYVLNPTQLRAYHAFVAAEQALGAVVEERFVFHGTNAAAVESILASGFLIGGLDIGAANGSSYGIGVYSAECPPRSGQSTAQR